MSASAGINYRPGVGLAMRRAIEYMAKQYAQESAPDIYHENLAVQISALEERGIIDHKKSIPEMIIRDR